MTPGIAHFTQPGRERDIDGITERSPRSRPMSINAGLDTPTGFFEGISHDDDRAFLERISAPTLLIASTAGQEVPSEVGVYLRQHIRGARLVELPGADHFAFATRPELVNLLIEQIVPSTLPPSSRDSSPRTA